MRKCLLPLLLMVTADHVSALPQQLPDVLGAELAVLEELLGSNGGLLPSSEDPKPIKTVKMDDDKDDKNKDPALIEESGLWPFVTHVTRTQIISTDSYCFRTRSKTVPIVGFTLPNNLGPKTITSQCRKKRAIDTASIMGESAAAEVARAISPSATRMEAEDEGEAFVTPSQSENPTRRGRFMYMVTSTRTKTVYKITATTAVTFICTPRSSILNMCPGAGDPGQLNILGQVVDKKKAQIKALLDQIKNLKDQVKGVKENIPIIGDIKGPKDDMKPGDKKTR